MSVVLAATWHPRGELARLLRISEKLHHLYDQVKIILPPETEETLITQLAQAGYDAQRASFWSHGRHAALRAGHESGERLIQYADMDRLVRWVETRPDELRSMLESLTMVDCLIIGRTPQAYGSHPSALVQTELITNILFSHLLGFRDRIVDFSAGSKVFSARAAAYVLENSIPGNALGVDSEWPILLYRGEFEIDYIEVDGLDWESADRFQDRPANAEDQRRLAAEYDADPQHWAHRVRVAQEITRSGLNALVHEISEKE